MTFRISTIVPTIGRPESLRRLLVSLSRQTQPVNEVVVADGSSNACTATVVDDPCWAQAGLPVRRIEVVPPHAVRQREAAIAASGGELLLLLDDDVELEPDCVAEMVRALDADPQAVAAMADFNNQPWPTPTRAWRLYLRLAYGLKDGEWQGRVVGPLLRFGYNPSPQTNRTCEWLGTGNSLIRRCALERIGGFSDFFLHCSTMNEDVDLGLRLSQQGRIVFCPHAKLGHFHEPAGRVTASQAAEDDLFNRYQILRRSAGNSRISAFAQVLLFFVVESGSNLIGASIRGNWGAVTKLLGGRGIGLMRILIMSKRPSPPTSR